MLLALREIVATDNAPLSFLSGKDFYETLTEKLKQFCAEHVKEKICLDDICRNIGRPVVYRPEILQYVLQKPFGSYADTLPKAKRWKTGEVKFF